MNARVTSPFEPFFTEIRRIVREEIKAANGKAPSRPRLLYSTKEAAEVLGVKVTWLSTAARSGVITCVRTGHYVQFSPQDLEEYIEKNRKRGVDR